MKEKSNGKEEHSKEMVSPIYLLIMGLIHFLLMFILMYSMVNALENVFANLNQLYMAGLMTTPMLILEIVLMKSMYENKKVVMYIFGASVVLFLTFFIFIRKQTAIGDKEFLRSMIPHHAGAILMCENSSLQNMEIKELCDQIISSQKSEIEQMKSILESL